MDDFPAAHSMDSAWFAVDAEGHIARFDTGENGAIPNAAAGGGGNFEPDFDALLLDALLAGLALRDELLEPTEPPADAPVAVPPLPEQKQPQRVVILSTAPSFAESEATYRQAPRPTTRAEATFREGEFVVVKEADPRVVVSLAALPPTRVATLRAFTDATVLLASDLYYVLREGDRGESPARGIFEYGHEHGVIAVKGSGTYGRSVAPQRPVTLDDVHPSIRGKLGSQRLPVQFAEAPVVELADHMGESDVQTYGTPLDPANAPPPPPPRAPVALPPGAGAMVTAVIVVLVVIALVMSRG